MCFRRWHSVEVDMMVEVAVRFPALLQGQHGLEEGRVAEEVRTRSSRVERSH